MDIRILIQNSIMHGNVKQLSFIMRYSTEVNNIFIQYIDVKSMEVLLLCRDKNIKNIKYVIPRNAEEEVDEEEEDTASEAEELENFTEVLRDVLIDENEITQSDTENDEVTTDRIMSYTLFDWEAQKERLDTVSLLIKVGAFPAQEYRKSLKAMDIWAKNKATDKDILEDLELIVRRSIYKTAKKFLYKDTEIYKECQICLKKRQREEEGDGGEFSPGRGEFFSSGGELQEPLYPCGHCGYCQECIKEIKKCPRCRRYIKDTGND